MTASFQVGEILQGQQKFAEAIAAWKGYLAKFPNGPQSADAQRAILDTQLLIAADHLNRQRLPGSPRRLERLRRPKPARRTCPRGPLPDRRELRDREEIRPGHRRLGAAHQQVPGQRAGRPRPVLDRLDSTRPRKGDPAEAIERFKKIAVEPWRSQARQRIAVMESKALVVITPRTFRSGEAAHLKITTRNIETLTFTAYKLSAEAYFRKKNALENVESLDIGLVAPDAAWTAPVPGYAKYKPVETDYELKKLELPGVYVVKVTDEKTLQATTLVIGSDLDAIVKTSREQVLVFAQDMKTGRGRPARGSWSPKAARSCSTPRPGRTASCSATGSPPRAGNGRLNYLVLDGPHVAGSGLGVPDKVAQGLTPRAYIYTDRPAYRPGQKVAIRGVVREVAERPVRQRARDRSTASRSPTAADG